MSAELPSSAETPGALKTWAIAVRPFAYTVSVMPVFLGLGVAHHAGHPVRWGLFALTLVGVLLFHTGANLLNDCFDYLRGLDREVLPVSGAIVRGLLSPPQVMAGAAALLALGVACGLYLVHVAGPVVLVLGLIGTFIAVTYTTGGLCLKFMALGDPAIFLAFGPLPVLGTFWVQAQAFSWAPLLWSVPLALYTVGILHANNWRDIESDRRRGCHTVASLLGRGGSAAYFRALILAPFALTGLYLLAGLHPAVALRPPFTVLLAFGALPAGVRLVGKTAEPPDGAGPVPAGPLDALTARMHSLFGVLLIAGFFLGRLLPGAG